MADVCARAGLTWTDVTAMPMLQAQAILDACDRRDAASALSHLETVHAGVAPVMVGRDGQRLMGEVAEMLKKVIYPRRKQPSAVAKMVAAAR